MMIHSGVLLHFPHVPSVVVALDSGMFLMIERHFLIANVLLKIAVVAVSAPVRMIHKMRA